MQARGMWLVDNMKWRAADQGGVAQLCGMHLCVRANDTLPGAISAAAQTSMINSVGADQAAPRHHHGQTLRGRRRRCRRSAPKSSDGPASRADRFGAGRQQCTIQVSTRASRMGVDQARLQAALFGRRPPIEAGPRDPAE
jgi:hypothetical protein